MKDRVEGFLKVAKERIGEADDNDVVWGMNDLYEDLAGIVAKTGDEQLAHDLKYGWEAIWNERKIRQWDEKFLKVIANDYPAPKTLTTGIGSSPLWSTNSAPNTILTTASMQQAAHDILKEQMKQQYKTIQMKDRYKTP